MNGELDILVSFLLGALQGLTEFLPISSTAHIRILPAFLNLPDVGAAYTAVIQLGSLIALFFYFNKDLKDFFIQSINLTKTLNFKENKFSLLNFSNWNYEARMPIYLIIGTIPISIFGLLFKDWIKGPFRSLYVIAFSLIFFSILLLIADIISKKNKRIQELSTKDAFLIGFAQALALIPGASRSGVTLMAGLFLNFNREASMRYSFLLSIPAIALSGFYELWKDWKELQNLGFFSVSIGVASATIVSYLTIIGLLKYLRNHSTLIFVIYRILLGIFILILLYFQILKD
ncbi:MAG: undecaprenyl-diphosphatase UppP [Leptonema sp. (in: bacteria)]